ncbi:hypothetical protein [Halonatronum saccharophilum]|uniref:hypothetical protein n=1 Tax=Halonatronum saccharophilum TaxID=150060 RepID=UPI0004841529|nr:hypothetical protein [Halonatronum saccharophilum]
MAYYIGKSLKVMMEKMANDPLVINVNPGKVDLYSTKPHSHFKKRCKKISWGKSLKNFLLDKEELIRQLYFISGDWDLKASSYRDYETYKYMKEIYESDDYTQTQRYKDLMEVIDKGEKFKHKGPKMKTKEDVRERYFKRYLKVFKSMEENGYLPGKAIDIGFAAIGRNGEVIKMQRGRHRLAIAKLVGVESIPLKVIYIHPKWVEKEAIGIRGEFSLEGLGRALNKVEGDYR